MKSLWSPRIEDKDMVARRIILDHTINTISGYFFREGKSISSRSYTRQMNNIQKKYRHLGILKVQDITFSKKVPRAHTPQKWPNGNRYAYLQVRCQEGLDWYWKFYMVSCTKAQFKAYNSCNTLNSETRNNTKIRQIHTKGVTQTEYKSTM